MSFSPDADFPVVNGEKGILHFVLRKKIKNTDPMGLPELVDIRGGTRFNIVPDELKIFFRKASAANLELVFLPLGATVESTGDGVLVTVKGKSAHAMEPWKGENAIQKFLSVVQSLDFGPPLLHVALLELEAVFKFDTKGEHLGIAREDDVSGPLSCNLAAIALDDDVLTVKCDIRYPVTTSGDSLIEELRKAVTLIGWELDTPRHSEPLFVPADSKLVRTLLSAYDAITGEHGEPHSIGGGTYSKALPNAVSFGAMFPGEEETAHQPNEYISLDSFRRMTHIYAEALEKFNDGNI
jgi:succinyl-diaminopimelate desuccinylase